MVGFVHVLTSHRRIRNLHSVITVGLRVEVALVWLRVDISCCQRRISRDLAYLVVEEAVLDAQPVEVEVLLWLCWEVVVGQVSLWICK